MAGRPPGALNKIKQTAVEVAQAALSRVDQVAMWEKHMRDKDPRVSMEAMKYLSDRLWGKPAQALQLQGDKDKPLEVVIRVLGS